MQLILSYSDAKIYRIEFVIVLEKNVKNAHSKNQEKFKI